MIKRYVPVLLFPPAKSARYIFPGAGLLYFVKRIAGKSEGNVSTIVVLLFIHGTASFEKNFDEPSCYTGIGIEGIPIFAIWKLSEYGIVSFPDVQTNGAIFI